MITSHKVQSDESDMHTRIEWAAEKRERDSLFAFGYCGVKSSKVTTKSDKIQMMINLVTKKNTEIFISFWSNLFDVFHVCAWYNVARLYNERTSHFIWIEFYSVNTEHWIRATFVPSANITWSHVIDCICFCIVTVSRIVSQSNGIQT